MARIDGVINNFLNHVTSGLSGFVTEAYAACERVEQQILLVRLLPHVGLEGAFAADAELTVPVRALREKFVDILQKETKLPPERVADLTVEIDFSRDPVSAEKRRRDLAAVPVYYGYDAVYRCTVSLRLASGEERTRSQHNP